MVLLSQKVNGNMIFNDCGKVFLLIFLGMENMVFFEPKKLMERWYLLINEKFLFWTLQWWEIWSFFQPKSSWKDDIYLVCLSFPRYFGTWEIWLLVQWNEDSIISLNLPNDWAVFSVLICTQLYSTALSAFNCMFLSCHVRDSEWTHTV